MPSTIQYPSGSASLKGLIKFHVQHHRKTKWGVGVQALCKKMKTQRRWRWQGCFVALKKMQTLPFKCLAPAAMENPCHPKLPSGVNETSKGKCLSDISQWAASSIFSSLEEFPGRGWCHGMLILHWFFRNAFYVKKDFGSAVFEETSKHAWSTAMPWLIIPTTHSLLALVYIYKIINMTLFSLLVYY